MISSRNISLSRVKFPELVMGPIKQMSWNWSSGGHFTPHRFFVSLTFLEVLVAFLPKPHWWLQCGGHVIHVLWVTATTGWSMRSLWLFLSTKGVQSSFPAIYHHLPLVSKQKSQWQTKLSPSMKRNIPTGFLGERYWLIFKMQPKIPFVQAKMDKDVRVPGN